MKKYFSVLLTLIMIISAIGTVGVSAADYTEVVTVPKGATYTLPTDITWDGGASTVDTSNAGYQIFTGKDATNADVTYRVNVGEYAYTPSFVDDMGSVDHNSARTAQVTGAKFESTRFGTYNNVTVDDGTGDIVFDASFACTADHSLRWYLNTEAQPKNGFKLSVDVKIEKFSTTYSGEQYGPVLYFGGQNAAGNISLAQFNTGAEGKYENMPKIEVQMGSTGTKGAYYLENVNVNIDEATSTLSSEWYNVTMLAGTETYDLYVNNNLVIEDVPLPPLVVSEGCLDSVWLRNISPSAAASEAYIDDLSVTPLNIVEGEAILDTALVVGDAAAQTVYTNVALSDGTTKSIPVSFNADTTAVATDLTATGTAPGFNNIAVTYDVYAAENVVNETIYAYPGQTVTLADASTVTATEVGILERSVSYEGKLYNYTIHAGKFTQSAKDDMSTHTTGTWNSGAEGAADINYVVPGAVDGMTLTTTVPHATYNGASSVETEGTNSFIRMYDYMAYGRHMWTLGETNDEADGYKVDFKVRYRAKAGENKYSFMRFQVANGAGTINNRNFALSIEGSNLQAYLYPISGVETGNKRANINDYKLVDASTGEWYSDWFTLTLMIDRDSYELYVEDLFIGSFKNTLWDGGLKVYAVMPQKSTTNYEGQCDIDEITAYKYSYVTDDLSDTINVVAGLKQEAKGTVDLDMSDGSKHTAAVSVIADTSKLAASVSGRATIAGFEGEYPALVKVCNYDVNGFVYENAEAPAAGGKLVSAEFANMGGLSAACKAIFAYYDSSKALKTVEVVDVPTMAKDAESTVTVNLTYPEEGFEGGKLKVFILDSLNTLRPLDLVFEY